MDFLSEAVSGRTSNVTENRLGMRKWPPISFWLLPLIVAFFRTAPFLWLQCVDPPEGQAFLGVGFIPKDFLAYIAFIRQVGEDGAFLLGNPFTLDPQTPRFILLFHYSLGLVSAATGMAPNWTLELSRFPLAFLFFGVLWWFLAPLVPRAQDRLWACVLVGMSGGVEGFFRSSIAALPSGFAVPFHSATWAMYGWNSYAAFFNPLWIMSLTVAMIVMRPILSPRGAKDWKDMLSMALGFFLLYWIHPYTAVVVMAAACARPILEILCTGKVEWDAARSFALSLGPALFAIAFIVRWQNQDAVFRASSSGVFGPQDLSVFWYPFALGMAGVLAIRGAFLWARTAHPCRHAMAAWITSIVMLHTSPVLNGYKFVFYLHLPICVLAAPIVSEIMRNRNRCGTISKLRAGVTMTLCFASFVFVTFESLSDVETINYTPEDVVRMVDVLSKRPRGNVLAHAGLGNIIPAFTPHRVWVGQWFLTPNYHSRVNTYDALTTDPDLTDQLKTLLAEEDIRYLVVPKDSAEFLVPSLGDLLGERVESGALELLVIVNFPERVR